MYAVSMSKIVLFQTIQFSIIHISVQFDPQIGPLSGATTPSQSGAGSDYNKEVLESYSEHSLVCWGSDVSYSPSQLGMFR